MNWVYLKLQHLHERYKAIVAGLATFLGWPTQQQF